MSWAEKELKWADLGDKRLNKRLVTIVEDLAAHPESSIPQACRSPAAMQAAYDFWANPRVKASDIVKAQRERVIEMIEHEWTVLLIQDTTELNYSNHSSKKGMGKLGSKKGKGLKVHSVMCVSDEGIPLGLIHQKVWAASNKNHKKNRDKIPLKDKESCRWVESLKLSDDYLFFDERSVITITDREGDIYDLLATERDWGSELLIRGYQNRRVKKNVEDKETSSLWQEIRSSPPGGDLTITLRRVSFHDDREAILTLRWKKLWIQPPVRRALKEQLASIPVTVILAEEEQPPSGEKPVSWLLITTTEIRTFKCACVGVERYSYRFLIERYHYVLKSGCQLEKLQLKTAARIEKALACYAIVAWRLLWLTYVTRIYGNESSESVLEIYEWQSLYCFITERIRPPIRVPTLNQCIRSIARLGGFIGRKSDKDPGVKVIWRGLKRLDDIAKSWVLGFQYGMFLTGKMLC